MIPIQDFNAFLENLIIGGCNNWGEQRRDGFIWKLKKSVFFTGIFYIYNSSLLNVFILFFRPKYIALFPAHRPGENFFRCHPAAKGNIFFYLSHSKIS